MYKECTSFDFSCYQYNLFLALQNFGLWLMEIFLDGIVSLVAMVPAPPGLDDFPTINIPDTAGWILSVTNAEFGFNLLIGAMMWRFVLKVLLGR